MIDEQDKRMFLAGFGFKLTKLRLESKKTRKAVCKDTGIGYSVLTNAEMGVADLSQSDLVKIAVYYGQSVDYLLSHNNINELYAEESGLSKQETEAFFDMLVERGRKQREKRKKSD